MSRKKKPREILWACPAPNGYCAHFDILHRDPLLALGVIALIGCGDTEFLEGYGMLDGLPVTQRAGFRGFVHTGRRHDQGYQ